MLLIFPTFHVPVSFSVLSVPALAGKQGLLGRLTKLNVDEDTLNADIADFFFSHMPFSGYKFYDTLDSMVMALQSGISMMLLQALNPKQ